MIMTNLVILMTSMMEILFADLEAGLASLLQNNVLRLQVAVDQPEQE